MLIRLVAFNARFVHSAPALFYLRQALLSRLSLPAPPKIEICQLTINDPYYQTLIKLLDGKPDIICFSAYVWNAAYLSRLLPDIREASKNMPEAEEGDKGAGGGSRAPKLQLVVGGPEAKYLNLPEGFYCSMPESFACSMVEGPAEGLNDEFFADMAANKLKPRYKAAADPAFAMPYNEEDSCGELKNRHIYYESSRGCPFSCSYCLSAAGRGVLALPLEQVFSELARLISWRPPVIRFVDRTFNHQPDRALAIWRFLVEKTCLDNESAPQTVYHFEISPLLFNEELFSFLDTVPAGMFRFELGLQSFNPESLRAVNRPVSLAGLKENIHRLRSKGNIHLHLDLLLGLPCDTEASYLASVGELLALKPHQAQLGLLKLLPGSPLYQRRAEFGLRCCKTAPYEVVATRWLTQERIAWLYRFSEIVEKFYNPRYFRFSINWASNGYKDSVQFFVRLAEYCLEKNFFDRAPTQEWLSELLAGFFSQEENLSIALDLLCLDWLVCGHRRLPEHLLSLYPPGDIQPKGNQSKDIMPDGQGHQSGRGFNDARLIDLDLKKVQHLMWHSLPDNFPPYFNPQSRSNFFKQTLFAVFPRKSLAAAKLFCQEEAAVVAILPQAVSLLNPRRRIAIFTLPAGWRNIEKR